MIFYNIHQPMEGETFDNEEDAPEIPVHENCGCQLIKFVTT